MNRQEIIKLLEEKDILYTIKKNCVSCDLISLAEFISSLLSQQRKEVLEEIEHNILWKCSDEKGRISREKVAEYFGKLLSNL